MKTRRTGIAFLLLSLVLMLTPVASAQTSGDAVVGAITVTAEGTASFPAEQVKVVITLGPDTNAYYEPATGMPIEGAGPLVIDASVVTNAMEEYGVPVNDIEIVETPFTGEWGSNAMPMPITVVATILQPTSEYLAGLLSVVREAAASDGLFVNQFGVLFSVADCRPLQQEARVAAVSNTRMEAEDQATALDTTVGDVVASRDVVPMNLGSYQANTCSATVPMKMVTPTFMATPFDPLMPVEVSVTVAIEVSYDIP